MPDVKDKLFRTITEAPPLRSTTPPPPAHSYHPSPPEMTEGGGEDGIRRWERALRSSPSSSEDGLPLLYRSTTPPLPPPPYHPYRPSPLRFTEEGAGEDAPRPWETVFQKYFPEGLTGRRSREQMENEMVDRCIMARMKQVL